jgi:hypothetical protein
MPRAIALYSLAVALFALGGCATGRDPNFFVAVSGNRQESTFLPQGYGWVPNNRIEISVYGEPMREGNELVNNSSWRSLGFVKPDSYGMFGYNSGALVAVVPRSLCGAPPQWLNQPLFLARDTETGTVSLIAGSNAEWFTFEPCH